MAENENQEEQTQLTRRRFLKLLGLGTAEVALMGIGGFIYSGWVEPNTLTVTEINIKIPDLSDSFAGYRLVQISDIHAGTWMNKERLMTVVNRVNEQKPDLIAITGDYVTGGNINHFADILINPLSQLSARDGVVTVLGNHDHWTNAGAVREIIQTANIRELQNDKIILERNRQQLAIAGVDDIWYKKADLDPILNTLPEKIPAILLAHEPDYADLSAETGRFALQISGHSHGGQVRLPIIGAPILPPYGRNYPIGQYQVRDMIQYTNRGVGMVPPTVRFGCSPEITVFKLNPA